jgi:cytochrome c-type biogenesis protein CcmE
MTTDPPIQHGGTEAELWEGPIPAHLARRRSGLKPQFLVAGLLLVGVILALMIYGLTTAKAYWLTVDEVKQRGSTLISQRLRVNGVVAAGSEDWNAEQVTLRFMIEDEENPGQQLAVVYFEPRPDNFKRAASVIVEGELLADGTFQADELFLKCPSRYEEAPEDILRQVTG